METIDEQIFNLIRAEFEKFTPIPDEEWERFKAIIHKRKIKKDEYFIQADENSSEFAFVTKGMFRFCITSYSGAEYNITFKKEGDLMMNYYPEMAGVASPYSIQAMEDAIVFVGDYNKFIHFYDSHQCWNTLSRRVLELHYMNKSWRELQLLMFEAKDRFINFKKREPDFVKRVPQYHIALYLGINPATLNRIIKNLDKEDDS